MQKKINYNLVLYLIESWQPFQFEEREWETWQGAWRKHLSSVAAKSKGNIWFHKEGEEQPPQQGHCRVEVGLDTRQSFSLKPGITNLRKVVGSLGFDKST